MPPPSPSAAPAPHTMQCMEVWGGTGESDNGVSMPGIDAWVFSRPYQGDAAGGDIHYLSSCGTGRISRMLVADVAGHGEKVADLARSLRTLMRKFVNYVDQSRFVALMNQEFGKISQDGRFATAIVATYFAPSSNLVLCNAAHPRPLAYSARRREWFVLIDQDRPRASGEPVVAANLPLGISDDERYEQFDVKMRPGDLILAYSDSLVEARAPGGEFLGEEGLLRLVRDLDAGNPAALSRALYARVEVFTGGKPPDDDVTIMLLRPNGLRTQAGIGSRLLTPVRFLGLALRRLLGREAPLPWPEPRYENILGAFFSGASRRWGKKAREL